MRIYELLSTYRDRISTAVNLVAENYAYFPFGDAYEKIGELYEQLNKNNSPSAKSTTPSWPFPTSHREEIDPTIDDYIKFFEGYLNATKFASTRSIISKQSDGIASYIVGIYIEAVDFIFSELDALDSKSEYQLDADRKVMQLAKISSIIASFFEKALAELRDIESLRAILQSSLPAYAAATQGHFDIGDLAKSFGSGALAVASPWIGIPALIAHVKAQSDKGKGAQALVEQWVAQFEILEGKVESLREEIVDSVEKTKSYAKEKSAEVNGNAIIAICKHLEKSGYPIARLEGYFENEIASAESAIADLESGD